MPPAKRQKVEGPERDQSQAPLSAVAARKRLQSLRSGASSGEESTPDSNKAGQSNGHDSTIIEAASEVPPSLRDNPRGAFMKDADAGVDGDADKGTADVDMPDALHPAPTVPTFDFVFPTKRQCRTSGEKGRGFEINIREGDRIKFPVVGIYRLVVASGSEITIGGATLKSGDSVSVYSPLTHALPVIRCSKEAKIRLDPYPNSLGRLDKLSPLFRGIWLEENGAQPSAGPQPCHGGCRIAYPTETRRTPFQPLSSPPEWNKKIAEMLESSRKGPLTALICGPKSSGKSTFSRILGNKIQSLTSSSSPTFPQVVLLDLDPGQPEFAPPGSMSLILLRKQNISPPFTHPWPDDDCASLIRCHALASTSPADNSELYIDIAANLYEIYTDNWRHLPLIVNTPGWILGTGLDLLSTIISTLRPAEIIYMSEYGPAETVESLRAVCIESGRRLSTLPSQQSASGPRTAAQLREMHTMSYFHYLKSGEYRWDDQPLSSIRPFDIAYQGTLKGISAIMCYGTHSGGNLLTGAINGMVLALVEIEDMLAFGKGAGAEQSTDLDQDEGEQEQRAPKRLDIDQLVSSTPEGIPYISIDDVGTLDPAFSQMLGLALVRGVDAQKRRLHLLTPVPAQRLVQIRKEGRHIVLVHGSKFDTPTWSYTEEAYANSFGRRAINGEDDVGDEGDDMPWVEVLEGDEKKPIGSQAWRVRRDLGKGT